MDAHEVPAHRSAVALPSPSLFQGPGIEGGRGQDGGGQVVRRLTSPAAPCPSTPAGVDDSLHARSCGGGAAREPGRTRREASARKGVSDLGLAGDQGLLGCLRRRRVLPQPLGKLVGQPLLPRATAPLVGEIRSRVGCIGMAAGTPGPRTTASTRTAGPVGGDGLSGRRVRKVRGRWGWGRLRGPARGRALDRGRDRRRRELAAGGGRHREIGCGFGHGAGPFD